MMPPLSHKPQTVDVREEIDRAEGLWVCPWRICNTKEAQECRAATGRGKLQSGCGARFSPTTTPEQARDLIGPPKAKPMMPPLPPPTRLYQNDETGRTCWSDNSPGPYWYGVGTPVLFTEFQVLAYGRAVAEACAELCCDGDAATIRALAKEIGATSAKP